MFGTKQNNQYLKSVLLLYLFPLSKFELLIIQVIPKGLYQRNAKISRFIEAAQLSLCRSYYLQSNTISLLIIQNIIHIFSNMLDLLFSYQAD